MRKLICTCDFCGASGTTVYDHETFEVALPVSEVRHDVLQGHSTDLFLFHYFRLIKDHGILSDDTFRKEWCPSCRVRYETAIKESLAKLAKNSLAVLEAGKIFDEDLEELLK